MSALAAARQPFFLERHGRRLFVLHFRPVPPPPARRAVVFFAPFAEEMNRARRMSTLLGEALATAGSELVVFDYSGTGDSDGSFGEARWADWIDDGIAAIEWAATETGGAVTVLGLRLGAALALAAAKARPERVARAVLWQPVLAGSTFLTQLLRLRIAATLAGGPDRETTQSLRARWQSGEALEIAGYTVGAALAAAIEAITADALVPAPSLPVDWLEIGGQDGLAPASRRIVDGWKERGARVRDAVVPGEMFWATQEIATAPELISATVSQLRDLPP